MHTYKSVYRATLLRVQSVATWGIPKTWTCEVKTILREILSHLPFSLCWHRHSWRQKQWWVKTDGLWHKLSWQWQRLYWKSNIFTHLQTRSVLQERRLGAVQITDTLLYLNAKFRYLSHSVWQNGSVHKILVQTQGWLTAMKKELCVTELQAHLASFLKHLYFQAWLTNWLFRLGCLVGLLLLAKME